MSLPSRLSIAADRGQRVIRSHRGSVPAPTRLRSAPSYPGRRVAHHQLLPQNLFRDALARERKRADRFEEALALLLISLNCPESRPLHWDGVIRALAMSTLDTDLVGWFEHGRVLGFVRPLVGADPAKAARSIAATVQGELQRCVGDTAQGCTLQLEIYSSDAETMPTIQVDPRARTQKARDAVRDIAKRALDVVGSLAALMALAPVFVAVAASVKLSSKGPVLFGQTRIGHGGRAFRMLKFRTMRVDADPAVHEHYVAHFIQSGTAAAAGEKQIFKLVDDPRLTSVGHWLRRFSLDELPQFWNVLKGDMSLVGPRPPLEYEVARYKPWHWRRVVEAKPGITGLWQVTGRSRTTFEDMVRLDLRYAKTCSPWTDVKILLATPRAVISGKGAH